MILSMEGFENSSGCCSENEEPRPLLRQMQAVLDTLGNHFGGIV